MCPSFGAVPRTEPHTAALQRRTVRPWSSVSLAGCLGAAVFLFCLSPGLGLIGCSTFGAPNCGSYHQTIVMPNGELVDHDSPRPCPVAPPVKTEQKTVPLGSLA
jgi:hypothetical protein